jgi:hypothetical protein
MGQIPPPTPKFASVKVAAEMVGLSTWTIKKRCDAGLIESRYDGRRRLVNVASLLAYIGTLPTERPRVDGVSA